MNFLKKLFGQEKLIEVPDAWRVGGGDHMLVEPRPDIDSIFTDQSPPSPRKPTEENRRSWSKDSLRGKRFELAMAYLAHPDPQVRASTLRFAKDLDAIGINQMLVDLLADPANAVHSATAQAIWDRGIVEFSLKALRDEIHKTGRVSHMSPEEALQAIKILRAARPDQGKDFDKWVINAWSRSNDDIAEHGHRLVEIYLEHNSFLGPAAELSKQVGVAIDREGGFAAMVMIAEAIQLTVGRNAFRLLEAAWGGVGDWQS